jgi:NAD(P)H-hydrate epimerase
MNFRQPGEFDELLAAAEVAALDRAAAEGGISGEVLMENAGLAVARAATLRFPAAARALVLAGPGKNGGDGYVAARRLAEAGLDVTAAALGPSASGDAAGARAQWRGRVVPLAGPDPGAFDLVVDALFGAGLSRPVEGGAAEALARVAASGRPVLAVDLPSGVDSDTGRPLGPAAQADLTVTFVRPRPGHLLLPGRTLAGEVLVADIGVPERLVRAVAGPVRRNRPALWAAAPPALGAETHKYRRGHVLVASGPAAATGASRLAARAALRAGAGLVTLAGEGAALAEHAAQLTAIMLRAAETPEAFGMLLDDKRFTAAVIGPGAGIGEGTRRRVVEAAARPAALVLDADALTAFAGRAEELASLTHGRTAPVVLTPHEGEFARLFGGAGAYAESKGKLARARAAAEATGAVVLLKGPDTVVATPDGRASILADAPPWLATAGAGDVLAGLIAGLLAQGMPAYEAASAAAWLHGAGAQRFGPGLTADDLPDLLPAARGAISDSVARGA